MHDTARLRRLAESVMRDRGFEPEPPPDAAGQAAKLRDPRPAAVDLRDLPWTSIDNPESRDLDQIEYLEHRGATTRLYVGIAGVAASVPAHSPIDRFAAHNTTSVYTGIRTFPMLPERLSFDLTSLLAGVERAAVVIESELAADGTLGKSKIYPARVLNHGKLDYPSVSAWLEGRAASPGALAADPRLRDQVELQDALAQTLAAARKKAGALDVDTGQVRTIVDEHGALVGLAPHVEDRAGRIIEELMIVSNRAVAMALDAAGLPSIRRVVKQPERWAKIVAFAAERGAKLPEQPSSIALSGFVDKVRAERPAELQVISLALIKLMGRGEYVAHAPNSPEVGHFGLATSAYVHSTAPNRRYPDLVIQRQLIDRPAPYDLSALSSIAARCSEMETAAAKVERRVQKSIAAALMGPRIGERLDAVVVGASSKGTYVRVLRPTVEGKLVEGAEGLEVGDRVKVELVRADVDRGWIDFVVR